MKSIKYFTFLYAIALLTSCTYTGKKISKQLSKESGKAIIEKSSKNTLKKGLRNETKRLFVTYSPVLTKAIDDDVVLSIYKNARYTERLVSVQGRKVPLLISPKFDPYLKLPKNFYGDPARLYDKTNPNYSKYVVDGCETNLGIMSRGLAPVYYNANKVNSSANWGHYFPFELHHGGQKAKPKYFALMAEEHKIYNKELHPKRIGSEIDRNAFGKKERAPLYKQLAEEIANM